MNLIRKVGDSLLHLFFPHVCEGCGSDLLDSQHHLCLHCLHKLPQTDFQFHPNNPIEKIFWGRLPLRSATAQYYFTKQSLIQHLMHQFKYRSNKDLGLYLGRLMGRALASSNRFLSVDMLVPLPLFKSRERKRGYNQSVVLCEGIAEILHKSVQAKLVVRSSYTDSQTTKGRMERWKNMEGRFTLVHPEGLRGKHVLLVDDVITTGATLESCGRELLQAPEVQLSIATLCFSSGN